MFSTNLINVINNKELTATKIKIKTSEAVVVWKECCIYFTSKLFQLLSSLRPFCFSNCQNSTESKTEEGSGQNVMWMNNDELSDDHFCIWEQSCVVWAEQIKTCRQQTRRKALDKRATLPWTAATSRLMSHHSAAGLLFYPQSFSSSVNWAPSGLSTFNRC